MDGCSLCPQGISSLCSKKNKKKSQLESIPESPSYSAIESPPSTSTVIVRAHAAAEPVSLTRSQSEDNVDTTPLLVPTFDDPAEFGELPSKPSHRPRRPISSKPSRSASPTLPPRSSNSDQSSSSETEDGDDATREMKSPTSSSTNNDRQLRTRHQRDVDEHSYQGASSAVLSMPLSMPGSSRFEVMSVGGDSVRSSWQGGKRQVLITEEELEQRQSRLRKTFALIQDLSSLAKLILSLVSMFLLLMIPNVSCTAYNGAIPAAQVTNSICRPMVFNIPWAC